LAKKLSLLATTFIITVGLFLYLFPAQAYAQSGTTEPESSLITTNFSDLLKIYEERRSGGQLNLETWYGGRSDGTVEESIGFGDIILLDIMEKLGAKGDSTILDKIKATLTASADYNQLSPLQKTLFLGQELSKINSDGAIQNSGKFISSLYQNRPASSVEYLADIGGRLTNFKLTPSVYAQSTGTEGMGFQNLTAILNVWKAFRNVAYLIFALGFIFYGVLIMLQIKISQNVVASIETALPKLVVTLVLITFSYAIAGFMIDLFYVIVGILYSVFINNNIIGTGAFGLKWAKIVSGQSFGIGVSALIFMLDASFSVNTILAGILSIPIELASVIAVVGTFLGGITILLGLIILLAVFITFLRLIWMLLQAYIKLLLAIIFSPMILLGNILPGSTAFSGWLKNILGELSIFGTTIIMLTLSAHFLGGGLGIGTYDSSGALWLAPPLWGSWGNVGGGMWLGPTSTNKFPLIGLGMLLITPKIANMIRGALKTQGAGYESIILDTLGRANFQATNHRSTFNQIPVGGGETVGTTLGGRPATATTPATRGALPGFGTTRNAAGQIGRTLSQKN